MADNIIGRRSPRNKTFVPQSPRTGQWEGRTPPVASSEARVRVGSQIITVVEETAVRDHLIIPVGPPPRGPRVIGG